MNEIKNVILPLSWKKLQIDSQIKVSFTKNILSIISQIKNEDLENKWME